MKKFCLLMLVFGFCSFAYGIKCHQGQKVCIVIKSEPLFKRAYFVNMSDKKVKITGGSIYSSEGVEYLDGRVFNRYSKTVIGQVRRTRSPITHKITDPWISYTSFKYKFIK